MPQKAVSWDSKLVSYSGEKRASPSNQTEASAAATVTQAKKPPVASAVVSTCFLAILIVTDI